MGSVVIELKPMSNPSFEGEELLKGTAARVIARLTAHHTVMAEGTMWDDYKEHVARGWSLIEEQFRVTQGPCTLGYER